MLRILVATLFLITLLVPQLSFAWLHGSRTVFPVITSLSPNYGVQGDTITINGTGFTGLTNVRFGLGSAASFTAISDTQATAVVPTAALSSITNVRIVTISGTSATSNLTLFAIAGSGAPSVASVTPNSGANLGGTSVTITGSNLSTVTAINFGGTPATGVSCTTTCTATSPAGTPGLQVDVTATNPSGSSIAWLYDRFTYTPDNPPVISSIIPNSGGTAGGTSVVISGSSFATTSAVHFGATSVPQCPTSAPTCFTVVSATTITVGTPTGTGTENVNVTNGVGTSGNSPFLYQDFAQSYVASGGATELRDLMFTTIPNTAPLPSGGNCANALGCPTLLAFNGFWESTTCAPGQGPQVYALTSSTGSWALDTTFAGTSPCGGAQFNNTNSVYLFSAAYDGSGTAIVPPVEIPVASGIDKSIYARNNTTGTWTNFTYSGSHGGVNRAMSSHEDDTGVNPISYLLIGNDAVSSTLDGLHDATVTVTGSPPQLSSITINPTPEPFCSTWTSGNTCATTCTPNSDLIDCTNLNSNWPINLSVTSATNASVAGCSGIVGNKVTLNFAALQAPLSPCLSTVTVSGVTCGGGVAPTGSLLAQPGSTASKVVVIATGTSCSGGTVTTPRHPQQTVLGWAGGPSSLVGSVVISGITGYIGANPNGTQTVGASSGNTLQYTSATDCSNCAGGTITQGSTHLTINSWSNFCPYGGDQVNGSVVGCTLPNIRITGITECPVSSGGNSAGKATFFSMQMNIWERLDNGSSSVDRIVGAVPYPIAATTGGQAQLRGLTCIIDSTKSGGYALLSHIEKDGAIISMDPNTGVFNEEGNTATLTVAQWGFGSAGLGFYNSEGIYPITVNGTTYYAAGNGDVSGPVTQPREAGEVAYSGFWVRSTNSPASASSPGYKLFPTSGTTTGAAAQAASFLNAIHPSTSVPPASGGYGTLGFNACGTGPCPVMVSTRAGPLASQFYEDGGNRSAVTSGSGTTTMTLNFASLGVTQTSAFSIVGLTSSGAIGNANSTYICGVNSTVCTDSSVTITTTASGTPTYTNAVITWYGGQTLFFGGFDANSVAVHDTAWVARAPTSMFVWP